MSKPDLAKVILYMDEETREFFGVRVESVWAQHTTDGRYRIDNIPFFTYQVRINDIVELTPHTDEQVDHEYKGYPILAIKRLVERSGHEAAQLIALKPRNRDLPLEEDPSYTPFEDLFDYIRSSPFIFEGNDMGYCFMVAIDIPPHTDRTELHQRLQQGEADKHWVYSISDDPD